MRNLIVALGALVLVPAGLLAAEIRGTIKSVDPAKNSVIVMVGPKEQMFQCTPKVQVTVLVSTRRCSSRRRSPRRAAKSSARFACR